MVELKTPVRHGEEDLWDIYDATGQKILGVYATDQAAGERIAADVIAALNEAAALRSRLEEAERQLQHQREYDERVPDPRHHKYFNFDCSSGCKFLVQKGKITALETTLAAIKAKCEQAENGSLRTTIRAIHQLASGGTP